MQVGPRIHPHALRAFTAAWAGVSESRARCAFAGMAVIRRAAWLVVVWVVLVLVWAARLVGRGGKYPWETE